MKKSILLFSCCLSTSFFLFAQSPARLFLQQKTAVGVGEQLCMQVFAAHFPQLDSLQFSIYYSTNALRWEGVTQPASSPQGVEVHAEQVQDGLLRLAWENVSNAQGVTITDSMVLFELCFETLRPTAEGEYMLRVDHPLPLRAFDINQQRIPIVDQHLDWIGRIEILPAEEVHVAIEDTVVAPGQAFCRKLNLLHTDKPLISMQFSLGWNPAIIRLDSVIHPNLPGLRVDRDFNLMIVNQGKLSCLWQDDQARGITEDSVAYFYEVCFTALDTIGNSVIQFTSTPTAIEFISADFNQLRSYTTAATVVLDDDPFMRPGDTNHDGAVDHFDLLNIGLGYGNLGANRRNADLDWENQPAANWAQALPQSQINYKHFDTDGNGLIDLTDARAIDANWHLTTEDGFIEDNRTQIREEGTPLYIETRKIFPDGEAVTFDIILGEESKKAENVYGLAFSIEYDVALAASGVSATFDTSWLGTVGENLLVLQKNNADEHHIDIALVRIDGLNQTGFGTIGQLHFTTPIFAGETPPGTDTIGSLPFRVVNVRAIDFAELEQPTTPMETTAIVDISTATFDPALAQKVQLFPNPAKDVLNIRTSDVKVESVILYNVNGQVILQSLNPTTLSVESLKAGLYFCKIQTDKGFVTKRVDIVK